MTSRRKWLGCSVLAVIGIPLLLLGTVMLVLVNSLGEPSDSDRGRSALVTSNPTVLPGSTLVEHIAITLVPGATDEHETGLITVDSAPSVVSKLVDDTLPAVVITGFGLNAWSCRAGSTCVKSYTLTLINLHAAPAYVAIKVNGLMETGTGGSPVANSSLTIRITP